MAAEIRAVGGREQGAASGRMGEFSARSSFAGVVGLLGDAGQEGKLPRCDGYDSGAEGHSWWMGPWEHPPRYTFDGCIGIEYC